jgi:RNA polymerase sigma-70 factor (ECF subfamily)
MGEPLTGDESRVGAALAGLTRDSYGRLLALLAAPGRDIAMAEDALADALERALTDWADDHMPANPEAWLYTVARNRLRDAWKSAAYRRSVPLDDEYSETEDAELVQTFPDRRLELMLVCAHPAISPSIRTPLMLQAVLGVDAAAIAAAYAVEPATMAQRLVRAKKRIRDTGIPFAIPEPAHLAQRLPAVLEAVYGAYAIDWQVAPDGLPVDSLAAEALHLSMVLAELLPDEPEVLGLAALVCLSEARRPARRAEDGRFVPLGEQDATLWDRGLIDRGERLLARAHAQGRPGRFQYEAAIQSAHCTRIASGPVDAEPLRKLYRALIRTSPSLGGKVALAALDGEIDGPAMGLANLDAIADPAVDRFQPAWAVRGDLLARSGRAADAAAAYRRAIDLTGDVAVARLLAERLAGLPD